MHEAANAAVNGGLDEVRRDWETLGSEDPLWAVLMKPGTRHGGWDVEEFLATGRDEVDAALVSPRPRAGRPTAACARLRMRRRPAHSGAGPPCARGRSGWTSRRRCSTPPAGSTGPRDAAGSSSTSATTSPTSPTTSFDLVYSSLVLQHLPPTAARAIPRRVRPRHQARRRDHRPGRQRAPSQSEGTAVPVRPAPPAALRADQAARLPGADADGGRSSADDHRRYLATAVGRSPRRRARTRPTAGTGRTTATSPSKRSAT